MAQKPLDYPAYTTSLVEPLFHALYYLQRTPGCEEEADGISRKLREEFMKYPEKKDGEKNICRIVDGIKYEPNGVITLTGYPRWYIANIGAWDKGVTLEEEKAPLKKNPSYTLIKRLNPIWYAQLMMHKGRRPSLTKDDKIHMKKLLEQKALFDSLTEEELSLLDSGKVENKLQDMARRLNSLFHYEHYRVPLYRLDKELEYPSKAFFFLSPIECEVLTDVMERNGLTNGRRDYGWYELQPLAAAIADILQEKPEEREWVMRPDWNKMTHHEDVKHSYWTQSVEVVHYNDVWDYFQEELADLSEENLKVLKYFGLEIEKEKEENE